MSEYSSSFKLAREWEHEMGKAVWISLVESLNQSEIPASQPAINAQSNASGALAWNSKNSRFFFTRKKLEKS